MLRWGLLIGFLVVLAAPSGAAAAGCPKLSGSFSVVRGSAGAGQISYTLRVKNGGTTACVLKGLPALRLLGAGAKPLPTKILLDPRYHARPFVLRPGKTASAMARFSPDVPGPGEGSPGKTCEPVAHTARVSVGGTTILAPIRPPTPVCEHGRLLVTPYR